MTSYHDASLASLASRGTIAAHHIAPLFVGRDIPDQPSILKAIEEFKRVKESEFLKRHSSGARPRKVYLNYGGERFPLKAIWAAAHQPPIHTRVFTTNVAKVGFRKLGFRDFWQPENSS